MSPDKIARQRELEEAIATTKTAGWSLLMHDVDAWRAALADVRACTDLVATKARLEVLDMIAAWPELLEQQLKLLERDEEAEHGAGV